MMTPDTMRILDRWIGSAVCRFFGLFRLPATSARAVPSAPRHILLIKLTEMGSTVLALPALRELRATWPDAKWVIIVFRNSRALLDSLALTPAEYIIELDNRSAGRLLISVMNAVWHVRRMRPELSLDFDLFSRFTAVFAYWTCREIRVGFQPYHTAGRERGHLLTHPAIYSPLRHVSETFLALVRTVTHASNGAPYYRAPLDKADYSIPPHIPSPGTVEAIRRQLQSKGCPHNAQRVLLNINASAWLPLRRWPQDRFEQVIRQVLLFDEEPYVILVGGPEDRNDSENMAKRIAHPRVFSVAGAMSFPEFLALCSQSHLMVCNDGGPAHFAALVDLPSVVLFGPESPALYRPLSGKTLALYKSFPCSPCVHAFNMKKSACPRAACLEAITVDEVMHAIRGTLAMKSDRNQPY